MDRTRLKLLLPAVALLAACTDPRWPTTAGEASRLNLVRSGVGSFAESDCTTQQISDWGYEVRCQASTSYARCGYHHGMSCCWPVEGRDEATDLLGESVHTQSGAVCEGVY